MNNIKLMTILSTDKVLAAIFSGIVVCAISILSIAIVAGTWFLL
jgi:hypothetical protein